MKKRSILSLVLAVVMLFSVLGVFPMTVSAAGSTYASDDAAIGAGYYFRTGAEGSATYYNSIYTACEEVGEGGTVTVLHNFELATAAQGVGKTWTDPKTYTIDGNGKTLTYKQNRVFDIACSNLTIKDLTIRQDVNSAISFGQVRKSSMVVFENVTATATQTGWGFIPIYGSLTLKGSSSITCTGTTAANNFAVRIDNDGNSDVTTTRVVTKA